MSAQRIRLPNRRLNESLAYTCNGLQYIASFGIFETGSLAEVYSANSKSGSHSDAAAKDSAIVCSLALQFGVPLDAIRHALLRDSRGNASSPLGVALDLYAATRDVAS